MTILRNSRARCASGAAVQSKNHVQETTREAQTHMTMTRTLTSKSSSRKSADLYLHNKICAAPPRLAFPSSILLVPVRVVDELPMKLLSLVCVELLPAVWAFELTVYFNPHVGCGTVTGLGRVADFHGLGHGRAQAEVARL